MRWAKRVVVIDSGSTDGTVAVCEASENAEILHRAFDDHTAQWNYGIGQVTTEWVLALDADYMLPEAFVEELRGLIPADRAAFLAHFRYCINGRPLRGTLYPPRTVLFRKSRCRYRQDGHTQLLEVDGPVGDLRSVIDHDDRKPLSRWLDSQRSYAVLEVEKILSSEGKSLPDRMRRMIWPAAPAAFLYTLFVKRLVLDGWPGIYYSLQRTYAELLLSLELLNCRLRKQASARPQVHDD